MLMYDKYGNQIEFLDKDFKYFNEGSNAKLYEYKDKIHLLKIYKDDIKTSFIIKRRMFNTLKDINDKRFVKLEEYYTYLEKFSLFLDGYTMENVKDDKLDLTNTPTEYIVEELNELTKLIDKLSKERIKIFDSHYNNMIFSNDKFTIIDPDSFAFDGFASYKRILLHNKSELLNYFSSNLIHYANLNLKGEIYDSFFDLNTMDLDNELLTNIESRFREKTPLESYKKLFLRK